MSDTVDWSRYRLAQMWEMVKNESTEVGLRQAQAWTDTAELCEDQANQLERAAAQLAETWVPNPASAAAAFQSLLRNMTGAMRTSADVARTNSVAISDITTQMSRARERMAQLVGQSRSYADVETPGSPQYALPGRVPPPARPQGSDAPPAGWRGMLDQQAREIMSYTESTVISQAGRVQAENAFAVGFGVGDQTPVGTEPGTTSAGSGSGAGTGAIGLAIAEPTFPVEPSSSDDGPNQVFDGGHRLPHGSDDPVLNGGEVPVGQERGRTNPLVAPAVGHVDFVNTPAGIALAPGGIIGNPAGSGAVALGPIRSAAGSTGSVRSSSATSRPGGTAPMTPMMPPVAGGRPGQSAGVRPLTSTRRRSTESDPWYVPQGGPAVLEPAPEPTDHDPGPGVIGLDR
jgi:hypothetical protein